jgi:hypothetical protein
MKPYYLRGSCGMGDMKDHHMGWREGRGVEKVKKPARSIEVEGSPKAGETGSCRGEDWIMGGFWVGGSSSVWRFVALKSRREALWVEAAISQLEDIAKKHLGAAISTTQTKVTSAA